MRSANLLLATTILTSCTAGATFAGQRSSVTETGPGPGIRVEACSPTRRVNVIGLIGEPVTFSFPEGENVYRVNFAFNFDSLPAQASWKAPDAREMENHPLGNNVTIHPLKPSVEMMTIITAHDKDGHGQRVHPFRMVSRAVEKPKTDVVAAVFGSSADTATHAVDQPDITYNIICRYPTSSAAAPTRAEASDDDAPPAPERTSRKTRRQEREQAAQAEKARHILVDSFNRVSGCHYESQPLESPIKPYCPLDNGQWTVMRFPGLSDKPTIYTGKCDGHEQDTRQHGYLDFVVVETIAPSFCLRLGSLAINVINNAYNPAGAPTGNGTIAPGHRREILHARASK